MSKEKEIRGHESLDLSFTNFQEADNKGHVRAKVRIAYAGFNRNYSYIPKEVFENAAKSLSNVPLVGNWLGDNFGGHDVIFETKGNEVIIKDATTPYGVVPEDCNPRWETVINDKGDEVEYFTCDVVLWEERFPEQIAFIKDNETNQSMEIMVTEGYFDDEDYFVVDDFYFSALCLLGTSEDPEDNVEPAFEDSRVTLFSYGKEFTNKFKQIKLEEDSKKGVETMDFEKKYNELAEDFEELKTKFEAQKEKLEEEAKAVDELTEKVKEYEIKEERAKKDALLEEYSKLLKEEVFAEIKEKSEEISLEDLEFELMKAAAEELKEQKESAEEVEEDKDEKVEVSKEEPEGFSFANKYNM